LCNLNIFITKNSLLNSNLVNLLSKDEMSNIQGGYYYDRVCQWAAMGNRFVWECKCYLQEDVEDDPNVGTSFDC
jgi:hypothetical protein